MSDFDQNRQSPGASNRMVWGLAALSVGLFFCSVLAAKLVGDMVDSGLSEVTAALQASPARKSAWGAIDSAATGSIPAAKASGRVVTASSDAGK
jgi:hypothetical protein